ncbi:MAG: PilZ domain-containing protein [Bdellovibrio bacteriovorus]
MTVPSGSHPDRRTQPRVDAKIQVRLAPDTGAGSLAAQNLDLSWGGASLLLPDTRLQVGESIKLEFPWTPGRSFYARAEVIRSQEAQDGFVAGVRFSKMLVRHETRLERLLALLIDPSRRRPEVELALSPQIDLDFMDVDGIATALEEIRCGRYKVTSFRPYEANQSLMLVLIWQGRLPLLRLRARVKELRSIQLKGNHPNASASAQALAPTLYLMDLAFEHPLGDLQRTIDPLTDRLTERGYLLQTAA